MKITYPDKTTGDTYSGVEATEVKGVVNANDDDRALETIAWTPTITCAGNNTHATPFSMSGPLTLTWDDTNASAGKLAIKKIVGDGNIITISGILFPSVFQTIDTTAGAEKLLTFMYDGNQLIVDVSGVTTQTADYLFTNTEKAVMTGASDGVKITNNSLFPSDGAGADEPVSYACWMDLSIGTSRTYISFRDDTQLHMTIGAAADNTLKVLVRTDGSNSIQRRSSLSSPVTASLHLLAITKAGENPADIKLYLDGLEVTYSADIITGTYTGFSALDGSFFIDLGNASGGESLGGDMQAFWQFDEALTGAEITEIFNSGVPTGLSTVLQAKCVQENLLNGNPNSDNIGFNGTNEGSVSYIAV